MSNLQVTNTLLLPVNKMGVRNTAWQTLGLWQVGGSFLIQLLTTMTLEIAFGGWAPGFFMWCQKAGGALAEDVNQGKSQLSHQLPGSSHTTLGSVKSPRVLKVWAHVCFGEEPYFTKHSASELLYALIDFNLNLFLPSIKSFKSRDWFTPC